MNDKSFDNKMETYVIVMAFIFQGISLLIGGFFIGVRYTSKNYIQEKKQASNHVNNNNNSVPTVASYRVFNNNNTNQLPNSNIQQSHNQYIPSNNQQEIKRREPVRNVNTNTQIYNDTYIPPNIVPRQNQQYSQNRQQAVQQQQQSNVPKPLYNPQIPTYNNNNNRTQPYNNSPPPVIRQQNDNNINQYDDVDEHQSNSIETIQFNEYNVIEEDPFDSNFNDQDEQYMDQNANIDYQ